MNTWNGRKFEIHRVRKSDVTDEPSYSRVEQPKAELVASSETQASSVAADLSPPCPGSFDPGQRLLVQRKS